LIVEPPEIEESHAVGLKRLGQFNAAFEDFGLLLEGEVGVELIALGTEFGLWRPRPIDLKERAGNVGDAQFVFLEDAAMTAIWKGDFISSRPISLRDISC
jgi:hypothetical protein